ncbi:hypothetical protein AB0A63_23205 [Lentzea sp. NPDC042327]|uniref:hypothetical protein n=1 Tax=Lentzea sp. NPDC042327 TaxID=3154801 RepID=UPI0033E7FA06
MLVDRPDHRLGYATELLTDRDRHGVLWTQTVSRRGDGRPEFARVHPQRQRRAMERLLCQVCGNPADQDETGVLWLLRDFRGDWPNWPEGMASTEPPVCRPCVPLSRRLCPSLRKGVVAVRVRHHPIAGVRGSLYRPGTLAPVAVRAGDFAYDDPFVHRVLASALIRELRGCTVAVDLAG